jgi:hypothetical protein
MKRSRPFSCFSQLHQNFQQNQLQAIQYLAQQYGVDLSGGVGSLNEQISAPQQQHDELTNRLRAHIEADAQQREHYRQTQERALTAAIESFAADKPYWSAIENEVTHQIGVLMSWTRCVGKLTRSACSGSTQQGCKAHARRLGLD